MVLNPELQRGRAARKRSFNEKNDINGKEYNNLIQQPLPHQRLAITDDDDGYWMR